MLEFRVAAAKNSLIDLERLWSSREDGFNIDEPGPKSGKTAAHVAAERANFKAIYWLFEKGADFHCRDHAGKTAIDYLQQKEFTASMSPMSKGDRNYHLCNAHYKIWLAHDPEIFMPYLYQDDFRQYREKNPDGYISLVYSETLLSNTALSDLTQFAEKHQIVLISFEKDLALLTDRFGTESDKESYKFASYELNQYPEKKGGNLAVVADLIRWSSVLLRKGNYADTDVEIGQHQWSESISMEKPFALNLGSLIYPNMATPVPWLNGDVIAASSLFSRPLIQGDFRITLSKTACFLIQNVQTHLLLSCQKNMKARITTQQFLTTTLSDLSNYLNFFFKSCSSDSCILDNFSTDEIDKIQTNGLALFSSVERSSILERMANLMKKRVEEEYDTPEMAHKHSELFQNLNNNEHEKFLMNYMQAIEMSNIKEGVKELSGAYVFSRPIWVYIKDDNWKEYSIYSCEAVQSAFRSTNTVKFDTDFKENERIAKTQKCADLSFTPFGMIRVLERSKSLKAKHLEIT